MSLLRNIRFYILLFAMLFAAMIYFPTVSALGYEAAVPELVTYYALWTVFFLYVTLLIGPLTFAFRSLPFRALLIKSTRALGVSAFLFAALHGYFAFFGSLGGFAGLRYLQGRTLLAVLLSDVAFLILVTLACTSFDSAVKRLGFRKWKFLHRFVYLAGVCILLHAFLMSSRFFGTGALAWVFYAGLAFLAVLYAVRIRAYFLRPKRPAAPPAAPIGPVQAPPSAPAGPQVPLTPPAPTLPTDHPEDGGREGQP